MEESKEPIAAMTADDIKIDHRLRDGFRIPFDSLIDVNLSFGPLQATIQWLADRPKNIELKLTLLEVMANARPSPQEPVVMAAPEPVIVEKPVMPELPPLFDEAKHDALKEAFEKYVESNNAKMDNHRKMFQVHTDQIATL